MEQQQKVGKTATAVRGNEVRVEVVYHQTQTTIVTFDDKEITLDNGGWTTSTTKTLMNQASNQFGLGFGVCSIGWQWYAYYQGEIIPFNHSVLVLKRQTHYKLSGIDVEVGS